MFSGQFLNSSSQARLVVLVGRNSYQSDVSAVIWCADSSRAFLHISMQKCFSSNTSLLCVSPRLPSLLEVGGSHVTKRSRGDDNGLFLNYTVMQDDAPGPDIFNPELSMFLRADPVFLPIDEDDREYRSSSGGLISIPVRLLGSLLNIAYDLF